jgi:hypothetical protein
MIVNAKGEITQFKARLVAMGNLQKNGSYTEISSSTIQVITFNSSPN